MYSSERTMRSRPVDRARRGSEKKAGKSSGERQRLVSLVVCLAVFLVVYIGKGVAPGQLQQTGRQLLMMIGGNIDFQSAFSELGVALAERGVFFDGLEAFCAEVFGAEQEQTVSAFFDEEKQVDREQRFLNSGPDRVQLTAHYLHLEQLPEKWFVEIKEQQPVAPEPETVPAAGIVLMEVEYQGKMLPDGYTMDVLSLGGLETAAPVMGPIWSGYGYRDHPIDGVYKFHNGLDIGGNQGDVIGAFASGTVEYIGRNDVYGNYLQIDHGSGVKSFYAHCSKLCVQKGQQVVLGEKIAEVGATGSATGPHLHFEVKCAGVHVDPAHYIRYERI